MPKGDLAEIYGQPQPHGSFDADKVINQARKQVGPDLRAEQRRPVDVEATERLREDPAKMEKVASFLKKYGEMDPGVSVRTSGNVIAKVQLPDLRSVKVVVPFAETGLARSDMHQPPRRPDVTGQIQARTGAPPASTDDVNAAVELALAAQREEFESQLQAANDRVDASDAKVDQILALLTAQQAQQKAAAPPAAPTPAAPSKAAAPAKPAAAGKAPSS